MFCFLVRSTMLRVRRWILSLPPPPLSHLHPHLQISTAIVEFSTLEYNDNAAWVVWTLLLDTLAPMLVEFEEAPVSDPIPFGSFFFVDNSKYYTHSVFVFLSMQIHRSSIGSTHKTELCIRSHASASATFRIMWRSTRRARTRNIASSACMA